MDQIDVNGLGLKKMGLGGAKGRNEQWSPVVLLLNTIRCFGPHFFQKCRIDARSISTKTRLKNTIPSIYGTFSRSKPKKYGEFFNQRFLQCLVSLTFV